MRATATVIALGALIIGALCYISYQFGNDSTPANSLETPLKGEMHFGARWHTYIERHPDIDVIAVYDKTKNDEQVIFKLKK